MDPRRDLSGGRERAELWRQQTARRVAFQTELWWDLAAPTRTGDANARELGGDRAMAARPPAAPRRPEDDSDIDPLGLSDITNVGTRYERHTPFDHPEAPLAPDPLAPTIRDVAALIRARTKDSNGNEVGNFTADTRPTDVQAQEAIDHQVAAVHRAVGAVGPGCTELGQIAVAYGAAAEIELSYFREQARTEPSPYTYPDRPRPGTARRARRVRRRQPARAPPTPTIPTNRPPATAPWIACPAPSPRTTPVGHGRRCPTPRQRAAPPDPDPGP